MRLESDDSLVAHNAECAAVHKAAYGLTPEGQTDQATCIEYTKTLSDFTSDKLVRKIVCRNAYIETLRNAMDEAEIIHKQARQEEITRLESNLMRETTISEETIDKVSVSDIFNFMSPGRSDSHFNSTMKNN